MFKESFKYYKSKQPPPDLSTLLRVTKTSKEVEVIPTSTYNIDTDNKIYSGLKTVEEWSIFRLKNKPGLIYIKNPFTALGQRYWITRCLKDFSKTPNKLNIDAHNYLKQNETWWEACQLDPDNKNLAGKLRWATLGYHHNWDTKVYSETSKNEFPDDLAKMCQQIAEILKYKNFKAEAAIINYYFMNSTLSGHTDHSEKNLDAPLFSFSFGQSAIFLIGGLTENDPALPILIESGDILIMSKESRLCYHAVPKILYNENEEWNKINEDDGDNNTLQQCWNDEFNMFIKNCRVNMNVRQVLKPGQLSLDCE